MNKYYLSALTAFVIWGFFALLLKPMNIYPATDILFFRIFCAGILLSAGLLLIPGFSRKNIDKFIILDKRQKRNTTLATLSGGILLTGNWYFFIYSMTQISIRSASYAYLVCPILTTVLAFFLLGEKLRKVQWIAVLLSVFSCLALAYGHMRDLMYSLIVALSYALYLITQRNNHQLDKLFILSVQMIFSSIILLPFFPWWGEVPPYDQVFYLKILLMAVGFTIVPLWLNLYALRGVSSSTMGMLLYINPLLNFIISASLFHEAITLNQIMSYTLILFSIILFNQHLWKSKTKTST
jgi:chloramphenicol-sensitive protein RarD